MDKIARFQFGVVGVGQGSKAHFVLAAIGAKGQAYDVHVHCGSQKWSGRGRSGLWGFHEVSEVIEIAYELSEDADEYAERIAHYSAYYKAKADGLVDAFDAAIEKYGAGFCAKCIKSGNSSKKFIQEKEKENV